MNYLDDDLNDSALFCKSITQKRKAPGSSNPKSSKQLRLNFSSKAPENQQKKCNDLQEESQSSNDKGNEHLSSYFQPKKTLNTCPLCLKSFRTDSSYSTHMKQCAKTHKMTTQQLLKALELQKKQMQERRDLGLSSQSIPADKKTTSKKKEDKDRDSYDLALGLALSKSLNTAESKGEIEPETQSTLKKFGITTTAVHCKKKNENKKSTLKERTSEERQRIIIEKVAVVLLDEEQEPQPENTKFSSNSTSWNHQFADSVNSGPHLWNLGENNEKRVWYVDGIKPLVLPTEETEGRETVLDDNLEDEISKLNLPQEEIHKNWKKMINNCKYSDVTGKTKDCQDYYLHSLVLFARRPEILEKDYESIFRKYNLSTVLIFLEYLYCGTLKSLTRNEMKDLGDLSEKLDYTELITVLNCLEINLSKCCDVSKTERAEIEVEKSKGDIESEGLEVGSERPEVEGKKPEVFEDKDLFVEEVDLTQSSRESLEENNEIASENESNAEKSYWSFLQHEKENAKLDEKDEYSIPINATENEKKSESESQAMRETPNGLEENRDEIPVERIPKLGRMESDDSTTRDLDDAFKMRNTRRSSDCILLSSGSDSPKNLDKIQERSRTPSPGHVDYEIPYFDPYDNFQWFSEEQFSPVNAQSQSLITGNVSSDSLKSPNPVTTPKESNDEEEKAKIYSGYCSTPVTIRPSLKGKSGSKDKLDLSRRKRRSNLSGSRILRKSLDLQFKTRANKSTVQRKSLKRKKDFAEVLTDSILNELSKSSPFQSSTPATSNNFVEITPIPDRDEFRESVTPSPNFSKMEEALLKEQLSKYGLKKNLGKTKARKILRYIYEELHPLYNTKTGKIVKILSKDTPKVKKKGKGKSAVNKKPKQTKNLCSDKNKQKNHNSSMESVHSDGSNDTLEGPKDNETDGSDWESFSETLTQTVPSNPVDLPSAFLEFLESNPDYHQKILLYEPIWLEELQKKLKESFKKHFKIADLMDYLDQKCITFRSEAQMKNNQRKNEKKKKIAQKAKALPDT